VIEQQPDAETYRSLFQLYESNHELGGLAHVLDMFDEVVAPLERRGGEKEKRSFVGIPSPRMLARCETTTIWPRVWSTSPSGACATGVS